MYVFKAIRSVATNRSTSRLYWELRPAAVSRKKWFSDFGVATLHLRTAGNDEKLLFDTKNLFRSEREQLLGAHAGLFWLLEEATLKFDRR